MIIIKDEILLTIHQKRSLMLNHKRIINSIKRNIFIIIVLLIVNSLFALDFEEKISEKYWLCEYYNILLEKEYKNPIEFLNTENESVSQSLKYVSA